MLVILKLSNMMKCLTYIFPNDYQMIFPKWRTEVYRIQKYADSQTDAAAAHHSSYYSTDDMLLAETIRGGRSEKCILSPFQASTPHPCGERERDEIKKH